MFLVLLWKCLERDWLHEDLDEAIFTLNDSCQVRIPFSLSSTVAMSEMYLGFDSYGTNKLTSRFVVPVCSALKGDGPAVFIASACVFVAQQMGVELDAGNIIFIIPHPAPPHPTSKNPKD
ncbi:hypothetical protein ACTXT7_012387 [Hymenolepis weldensis]